MALFASVMVRFELSPVRHQTPSERLARIDRRLLRSSEDCKLASELTVALIALHKEAMRFEPRAEPHPTVRSDSIDMFQKYYNRPLDTEDIQYLLDCAIAQISYRKLQLKQMPSYNSAHWNAFSSTTAPLGIHVLLDYFTLSAADIATIDAGHKRHYEQMCSIAKR